MLQQLTIHNYAIIDELTIHFHKQFNIITGETGAGKSILMGALGLVLGDRADTSVLFEAGEKCVVEARFLIGKNLAIAILLADNDLDEEDGQLIVRREISASGKSRSFINDTPVTLGVLRAFATQLVDLHQQFDTLELGEDDFQRNVVDSLAGHGEVLGKYQNSFQAWSKANKDLNRLEEQQQNAKKEFDYFSFLFEELENAAFTEGELEALEEELKLLENAETVKQVLSGLGYLLNESDQPLAQQLKIALQQLQSLKTSHADIDTLAQRLQAAYIEIKDIGDEASHLGEKIGMDAERLEAITARIDLGIRLLKKHNAANSTELVSIQQNLQQQLQQVLHIDDSIAALQSAVATHLAEASKLAGAVSQKRLAVVKDFEQKVGALLRQVGMPNANLKLSIAPNQPLGAFGNDEIKFLFDANKSGRFEPLEKVASGGELSRLMLSIKSIVARKMQLPTLIFDEIDTGISGEAARQVGIIMKALAEDHQVIAITHQPQIAARASAHYFVHKKEKAGRIKTQVRQLSDNERVDTIAAMLSGENITESALQTAREMVNSGN